MTADDERADAALGPTPVAGAASRGHPSPWVVRFADLLAGGATALDVACGRGRHIRFLRSVGLRVVAVDRDASAAADLAADPGVELVQADLEDGRAEPLPGRRFTAVVVTNYLHRALLPGIVGSVEPAGVLLYETFSVRQARLGRPANPAYLLQPGELLDAVRPRLAVVAFEDLVVAGPRAVQRVAAVGPHHSAWPGS